MKTEDIEGTRPNVFQGSIRTKRVTDPLSPIYKLTSVEYSPPTPPKFIRDTMKIDVIYKTPFRT